MAFFTSNAALILGAVFLAATLGLRRLVTDAKLRDDLSGAVTWFSVFLAFRAVMLAGELVTPKDWHPVARAIWMMAFAYGVVRFTVALVLFARRKLGGTPTQKIHRDVADFVLYLVATVAILKRQLQLDVTTLLGTSAVLSLVLGFALQDTLSNLFSGLSLQFDRPFVVGDFIKVGAFEGRVVQTSWRSTRIETLRNEVITLPNALAAREPIVNFSRGGQPVAIDLSLGIAYDAPPTVVKREILEALAESPAFLKSPAPWVRTWDFADSAVKYQVRVWLTGLADVPTAHDEFYGRLWYRLARAGIEIPFPQRVVTTRAERPRAQGLREELLNELDFFAPFDPSERRAIAQAAAERHFGLGEAMCVEGREGETFYVLVSGRASVRVGSPAREITTLARGQCFGEMSLLTGEPRAATVVATEDSVVLEFDRAEFTGFFNSRPELVHQMAELLAKRRAQLATVPDGPGAPAPDAASVLTRLRRIFAR